MHIAHMLRYCFECRRSPCRHNAFCYRSSHHPQTTCRPQRALHTITYARTNAPQTPNHLYGCECCTTEVRVPKRARGSHGRATLLQRCIPMRIRFIGLASSTVVWLTAAHELQQHGFEVDAGENSIVQTPRMHVLYTRTNTYTHNYVQGGILDIVYDRSHESTARKFNYKKTAICANPPGNAHCMANITAHIEKDTIVYNTEFNPRRKPTCNWCNQHTKQ